MTTLFKQRLTKILDDAELPEEHGERVEAFATIFDLKRYQVSAIFNGKIPEDELLEKIAQEFEVKKEWLSGVENAARTSRSKETAKTVNKNKDTVKMTSAAK